MVRFLRLFFATVGFLSLAPRFAAAAESRCTVEARPGVSDEDRDAIDEILCSQLRDASPNDTFRVRAAKLGSKTILTVFGDGRSGPSEHQVILDSIDELPVAAPRLATAAEEKKPLAETLQVSNVLGQETRTPRKKSGNVNGWVGLGGVAAPSFGIGPAGAVGLSGGSDRWTFIGEGRLGLLGGSGGEKNGLLALSAGVRHHFTALDIAPFVGAGASVLIVGPLDDSRSRVVVHTDAVADQPSRDAVGLAGGLELGVDVLRTNTVGGAVVLRGDLAAFTGAGTSWSPIFTAGLAMRF